MVAVTVTTSREDLLVELVDEAGSAIGSCTVAEAHTEPGRHHRAFSVLLYDDAGRVLLQRRAAVKTRFASRWSNTCCGHPAPGENITAAALVRLADELGVRPDVVTDLREAGSFTYRAADPDTGRVEYEFDHVLVGRLRGEVTAADPAEVSECAWFEPERVIAEIPAGGSRYTPWLIDVLLVAADGDQLH